MIDAGIVLTINPIGYWDVILSHALYTEHEKASEWKPWPAFLDLQGSSTVQTQVPGEGMSALNTKRSVWFDSPFMMPLLSAYTLQAELQQAPLS